MSFRKRVPPDAQRATTNPPLPSHCRLLSPHTPPTTSTGLSQLDSLFSGGLPLGSLTIFLEDYPTAYHTAFLHYITAQGIQARHAVALASFCTPASHYLDSLPACVSAQPPNTMGMDRNDAVTDMKIAWRYQKREGGSAQWGMEGSGDAFSFDLSGTMEVPKHAPVSCLGRGVSAGTDELLEHLQEHLKRAQSKGLVSRVVMHGVSGEVVGGGVDDMARFLGRVRGLMRMYGAVAVVSCAPDVDERVCVVAGDAVVKVDSFGGEGGGKVGLGREWLGVLIVKKGYGEGGRGGRGAGDVWVFKRGRRKFVMERATAAPDDEDFAKGGGKAGGAGEGRDAGADMDF